MQSIDLEIAARCPCFAMPASECTCAKLTVENVVCPRCFQLHTDVDEMALKPHKIHLCEHCGNLFEGTYKAVSHPCFTSEEFPEKVQYFYPPLASQMSAQKSDYEQMIDAIQSAYSWLQHAYKLMESQEITSESEDGDWPIHLADAVHYCGEVVDELDLPFPTE